MPPGPQHLFSEHEKCAGLMSLGTQHNNGRKPQSEQNGVDMLDDNYLEHKETLYG